MEVIFKHCPTTFGNLPNGAYFMLVMGDGRRIYKKWVGLDDLVLPTTGEVYNAILISPDERMDKDVKNIEDFVTLIKDEQGVFRYNLVRTDYCSLD